MVHGTTAQEVLSACDENMTVSTSEGGMANPAVHFFRGLRHRNLSAIRHAAKVRERGEGRGLWQEGRSLCLGGGRDNGRRDGKSGQGGRGEGDDARRGRSLCIVLGEKVTMPGGVDSSVYGRGGGGEGMPASLKRKAGVEFVIRVEVKKTQLYCGVLGNVLVEWTG